MSVVRPFSVLTTMILATGALVLSGCGAADPSDAAGEPPPATPASTQTAAPSPTAPASQFTGTIGGDPQLEGGCLWLQTEDERYELRFPDDFAVDLQTLTITTPEGTELTTGDTVQVTGAVLEDMVSVCQVGPLLDVRSVATGSPEPAAGY